jgi:tRNA-dihydrouridine synthase
VVVDTVRSAVEAAEKLHPLSRLVVLADGLITTEDTIAHVLRDTGHDALMVVPEAGAEPGLERVGSQMAWAGSRGSTRVVSPRCRAATRL